MVAKPASGLLSPPLYCIIQGGQDSQRGCNQQRKTFLDLEEIFKHVPQRSPVKENVASCPRGKGCKLRAKRVQCPFCLLPPVNPVKLRGKLGWEHVPIVIGQGEHIRDESERERKSGLMTPNPRDSQNQEVPAPHRRPEGQRN